MLTEHSLYSYEDQLKNGYIPLSGGHRVGLVGQTATRLGQVTHLKDISGFNIRIAREVIGCSRPLLRDILDHNQKTIHNTLIISPPQQGKTTLLRDFSRQISDGNWPKYVNWPSKKVGIVDERSEIAACIRGVPSFRVGTRTDVLDRCPKAEGMMMLIRSMSPHIIIVDEMGTEEDAKAIDEASHAGIRVLCSAHGFSFRDVKERPTMKKIIESGVFQRYILIGNQYATGTVFRIFDGGGKEVNHQIIQRGSTECG
jgi:stage III sporulation protein AA